VRRSLPVHSAHVGEEREVFYRWHPYFGHKVSIRRIEQRATGLFLRVLGPDGFVVAIAGWMVDPMACAGMAMGPPQVDLAALIELKMLVAQAAAPSHFRGEQGVAREKGNEALYKAGTDHSPANEPGIRAPQTGWARGRGAAQGDIGADTDIDASRWARDRGGP
jgi:hypothetical protein